MPGLAAKPIIDIVLEVPDRAAWPSLIEPLQRLAYVHWAENPDTTKMFFVKGMPPFGTGRTHHVHADRDGYTKAKEAFVREALRKAASSG